MDYGHDFAGLFESLGELNVTRRVLSIVNRNVQDYGPSQYVLPSLNQIRRAFGLASQGEASALFRTVRDNIDAARTQNQRDPDIPLTQDEVPHSPNILGGDDIGDRFVYQGHTDMVDDFGDLVRRVPFLVESPNPLSINEIRDRVGEALNDFVEKYLEELVDEVGGGGLHPAKVTIQYVGQRNG